MALHPQSRLDDNSDQLAGGFTARARLVGEAASPTEVSEELGQLARVYHQAGRGRRKDMKFLGSDSLVEMRGVGKARHETRQSVIVLRDEQQSLRIVQEEAVEAP